MLDEGIDVPDANLGIVMSASRTRRQMIQRMGRILRRKRPGVAARFVIMFAQDTLEDPANHIERDGFLDEIERISDASGIFDSAQFDKLDIFLAEPGPEFVPEPARANPAEVDDAFRLHIVPLSRAERDAAPYLELALSNLPVIAKPRVETEAVLDRTAAARDRAHRLGVANPLHRMRRGVTAGRVPMAGPRPDRCVSLLALRHGSGPALYVAGNRAARQ